jgi:hypothetical protein
LVVVVAAVVERIAREGGPPSSLSYVPCSLIGEGVTERIVKVQGEPHGFLRDQKKETFSRFF